LVHRSTVVDLTTKTPRILRKGKGDASYFGEEVTNKENVDVMK
jgi:tRNA A37 threonylcarbamoyladenosine synthetase subunit TsaC/SUA5/YrdC